MNIFQALFDSIQLLPWRLLFLVFRDVMIVLDLFLIAGVVILVMKAFSLRPSPWFSRVEEKRQKAVIEWNIQVEWQNLLKRSKLSPPQSYTLAIIEADKLVDTVLKRLGYEGEHMADRLERLQYEGMKTLDKLWRAHKIRNELVHMPDFVISPSHAQEVLSAYEAFLKELGVVE